MKKIYIIFGVVCLLILLGSMRWYQKFSAGQKSEQATLIVGTASGYAPFVSVDGNGRYEGFDIDVAHALAKQMGKQLVIKDLGSMVALFTALEQGSIDLIMWGISITKPRLEKVAMVHYQGQTVDNRVLLFWNQVPTGVATLSDMKGKTVCVEPLSSEEAILDQYEGIQHVAVDKIDDALLNIQYGKCDAAFVEPTIARKFAQKYSEIKQLVVALEPDQYVQGNGIVIKQGNAELIESVHSAVDVLKTSGIIAQLEAKWGLAS